MARKRTNFLSPLPALLGRFWILDFRFWIGNRFLNLGSAKRSIALKLAMLGLALSLCLAPGSSPAQDGLARQAQLLTQQGQTLFDRGQPQAALSKWQQATQIYRQLGDKASVSSSLLNQSLALQELGSTLQACEQAIGAIDLPSAVCQSSFWGDDYSTNELRKDLSQATPSPTTLRGWQQLGKVLRQLGKLDESEVVLQTALEKTEKGREPENIASLRLDLANTDRSLSLRAIAAYQMSEAEAAQTELASIQTKGRQALELYQAAEAGNPLPARLNRLRWLVEIQQWQVPALKPFQQQYQPQIEPLTSQLLAFDFNSLPPYPSAAARLHLAHTLLAAEDVRAAPTQENRQGSPAIPNPKSQIPNRQVELLTQEALEIGQNLNHPRLRSQADGTLGRLYRRTGELKPAKQHLESALRFAQATQSWDLAYQWQWQLGQLAAAAGDDTGAIAAYQAATDSIDLIRSHILATNPDWQFSFRDKIEPVYLEYLRLLLSSPSPSGERVIALHSRLRLAELENYLQCGRLELVDFKEIQAPALTVVHLLDLGSSLEVIVRSGDGWHFHSIDANSVRANLQNLIFNVQDERLASIPESAILYYSQQLYRQLIAPIEPYLPDSGTLVFDLDSGLANLPIALLHDGQNYLVQQYSLALTLGSLWRTPQALPPGKPKALVAGISQTSPSFQGNWEAIPEVADEVAAVRQQTRAKVLLDEEFTSSRLFEQIDKFPIVHLSTHGRFSSNPQKTSILAWDKAIDLRSLGRWLKTDGKGSAIELLVLSACESAKGDKRSALGLAGVAATAGARSTLASLWPIDAARSVQLMGDFYRGLNRGLSKAEALRAAQLGLMSNPEYKHPYYWGALVLVGSWL
jgi:CHAT domain-containing protein